MDVICGMLKELSTVLQLALTWNIFVCMTLMPSMHMCVHVCVRVYVRACVSIRDASVAWQGKQINCNLIVPETVCLPSHKIS